MGRYNAEISAGSLLLPESRRIARLLLTRPTPAQWAIALKRDNLLQKSTATAQRQARLIRNRLETLDDDGLQLIAEGEAEVSAQLLLGAAIRHSHLLGDFLRDVYGADLKRLEHHLSRRRWDEYLTECAHRDPAVAGWAVSTRAKLFQVIVRILVEAKYLDSVRGLALTPPMLHPLTRRYLVRLGDTTTLSRMEPDT